MLTPDPDLGGDMVLTTPRFELRPLSTRDAPELLIHFADPRVTAFMDIDPLTELEEAGAIVAWAEGLRAVGGGVRWAIRARSGGDFVGTVGFNALVVERGRRGEIAYDLACDWWGRGAMGEVLPMLMGFGFERLALHRLEALVTPGNDRSSRLLERHGFEFEGVLRGWGYWKGRFWDQMLFGLTRPVAAPNLNADQTAGRSPFGSQGRGGGKSGLHDDKAAGNARRGRPQGKRHRKQTAPWPRPRGKGERVG